MTSPDRTGAGTAFGCPRDFLDQRYVYTVISPRARGLSVGVNLNPDHYCNYDCLYCEVDRLLPPRASRLDVEAMSEELRQTLALVYSGGLRDRPCYREVPDELLRLRHVTLSGDGEPTQCPEFSAAVLAVTHVRACGRFPFFKIVLVTNASGLHLPAVREGLRYFTRQDEVWAKLEAGSLEYHQVVNRPKVPMDQVLDNIRDLARHRPVIIQSLFPSINGNAPPADEIEKFARRLLALKEEGAQIPLVQIYSATRPTSHPECGHLRLRELSSIAQTVRTVAGLRAEVF